MTKRNYNHGKLFSPSPVFTGYVLIAGGLLGISYSVTALFLIIPGAFMAFTSTGTILDIHNKRVKPYTSFFGIIRTGKWINQDKFTRFNIDRATRKYTTYSRGSVRFDMDISDIRLMLINRDGTLKVVINKYKKFSEAQAVMEELTGILFPEDKLITGNAII
jgi:hypothetical protein